MRLTIFTSYLEYMYIVKDKTSTIHRDQWISRSHISAFTENVLRCVMGM